MSVSPGTRAKLSIRQSIPSCLARVLTVSVSFAASFTAPSMMAFFSTAASRLGFDWGSAGRTTPETGADDDCLGLASLASRYLGILSHVGDRERLNLHLAMVCGDGATMFEVGLQTELVGVLTSLFRKRRT